MGVTFTPPARYQFEPELHGPAPRPLPDALSRGPHPAQRRRGAIGLALFGAVCLLVSALPIVRTAGLYFLPLAWADWIGIGSLALAAVSWADLLLRAGRTRWVRDGSPLVAQVLDLVKAPSAIVNGTPAQGRFTATIGFVHPETAVPDVAQLQSDDFSWDAREQYDTPFRVGDYVTALFLPGQFEKSLRLYPFLGLRTEHELRRGRRCPLLAVGRRGAAVRSRRALHGRRRWSTRLRSLRADRLRLPARRASRRRGCNRARRWPAREALADASRAGAKGRGSQSGRTRERRGARAATPFLGAGAHGWVETARPD